jgi:ATP-binding cassette, subfamily F, member 3
MELIAKRGLKGIPKNMSMLLVRQEIVGNDLTPVEFVLRSDPRVEGLKLYIAKAESIEKSDPVKLAAAYERLVQIEADDGPPEPRARKILSGMGFSEEMQVKATRELSGGWRMRVSLSCALFANPDLLLLDEPTNHLDLEAVLWLERYLSTKYRGTVLVVSHDRHFLNEIVTDVVHFYRETLNTYRGDISNYEAVVDENKKRQLRLRENQEAKREHLQKYIDLHAQSGENGVKAARQRKSRMKKLDKIGTMAQEGKKYKVSYDGPAEEVEEVVEDEVVELKFPDPGSFDSNILALDQASFGYSPDRLLLKDVDLTVDVNSRIALLGRYVLYAWSRFMDAPRRYLLQNRLISTSLLVAVLFRNGSGKSTLIKLIVGALQPLKGKATIDGRAKIEYLAQHQLEQLDPEGTPMDTLLERYPGDGGYAHKMELRRYLANFGLGGEVLPLQKINTMSGGQKCRLCLASAMYRKPHLLILDEPTSKCRDCPPQA